MSVVVTSLDLLKMVEEGKNNLKANEETINSLNVFPVPDGDTGTNMRMTIEGGAKIGATLNDDNIGSFTKSLARAMVLSARGNSGVILSQFFKGMSIGLEGKQSVSLKEFAEAFVAGTKKAYSVVQNPTEGTILTVMREAGEALYKEINHIDNYEDFFNVYLKEANESLKRTPDLLPVLKKAGVIDSGGAGFIKIVEGMKASATGKAVGSDNSSETTMSEKLAGNTFNADSELTYGYCTEFILQLQNKKVDIPNFDLNKILHFLESLGNSIVCFKDDDLVKVHVHTFDPGLVLTEMRKYGEFVTIKIENMNVQHSENSEMFAGKEVPTETKIHKKYATVAVANGEGLVNAFKEMGVDQVVTGGQTMNTSTQDFIDAFDKIDAEYILVFPNNSNIKMAANAASENYDKAKVIVIPTRTIAEGYSSISMLNFDSDNIDEIVALANESRSNVSTLEVTYSIRDCVLNDINVKKGSFICLYNDELISCNENRLEAVKEAFRKMNDFADKQVVTILCGQDVDVEECSKIQEFLPSLNRYVESYPIQGNQDIYSYIIGIE